MSYLPEEILLEIFSRLPKRSLLRFRCVSKSLCTLFDTLSFQRMYHELSNIKNGTRIAFRLAKGTKKYSIDYKSVSSLLPLSTSSATMCECEPWNYPSISLDFRKFKFLTSSYNGFICLRGITSGCEELYILNLSTKWYKKIPTAREVNNDDIDGYGFGYDYKIDDYKLVRVVSNMPSKCSVVDVYTLASNSWKRSQSKPFRLYYRTVEGVLSNGSLHWLARTFGQGSTLLVCFDIVSEKFKEAPLPEAPMIDSQEPLEGNMFHISVGVLGECLCLVFHVRNIRIDVWIMQEYGVRESWTKSFSITHESIISSMYMELIWSFRNSEILWMVDQGFVLYDPKNNRYRELMLDSLIGNSCKLNYDKQ